MSQLDIAAAIIFACLLLGAIVLCCLPAPTKGNKSRSSYRSTPLDAETEAAIQATVIASVAATTASTSCIH